MFQKHHQTTDKNFIIQSKRAKQKFKVDKRVIDASTLLKNICDFTEITEPIVVDCSGESLKVFIKLINNYKTLDDDHDYKFEKNLYDSFKKKHFRKVIQDLCILDSDFFLDSVADYILGILGNEEKGMDSVEMQKYLGLENDFSEKEKKFMKGEDELKYFLSIDTKNFEFPFPNKNLYCLKTHYRTPMNALIARIVKRSNYRISYQLSLINKTIKNEIDRHPLKLEAFHWEQDRWNLHFGSYKKFGLSFKKYDKSYFDVIEKRKIIPETFKKSYYKILKNESIIDNDPNDFVIAEKIDIHFSYPLALIYLLDISKCPYSSISCAFNRRGEEMEFKDFYDHLVAKNLSKEITISPWDRFKFTESNNFVKFYKKPNVSKFNILHLIYYGHLYQGFKEFVMNYMEDEGIIKINRRISGFPHDKVAITKVYNNFHYSVLDVKKYMECIDIRER